MGREIRKVIPNWEHPRQRCEHSPWAGGCDEAKRHGDMCLQPLYDHDYESTADEWLTELAEWEAGSKDRAEMEAEEGGRRYYWEYNGEPPDRKYYRPKWTPEEAARIWNQLFHVAPNTAIEREAAVRVLKDANERGVMGARDYGEMVAEIAALPAIQPAAAQVAKAAEEIATRFFDRELPMEAAIHSNPHSMLRALAVHVITRHLVVSPIAEQMKDVMAQANFADASTGQNSATKLTWQTLSQMSEQERIKQIRNEVYEISHATLHGDIPLKTTMRLVEHLGYLLDVLAARATPSVTAAPTEVAARQPSINYFIDKLRDAAFASGNWDEEDREGYKIAVNEEEQAANSLKSAIETAIAAERERCAGIAENNYSSDIAELIREGKSNPT